MKKVTVLWIGLIAAAAVSIPALHSGSRAAAGAIRGAMDDGACDRLSGSNPLRRSVADTASIRLVLNIPAFRLDIVRAGAIVRTFPVAVGAPAWPTPIGRYVVDEITWNPRWVPPPSEWARGEKPMEPGPQNPMGRVKLAFAPYYYLHGTPLERSIGGAGSHGCVRLRNEDAIELARLVQQEGLGAQHDHAVDAWLAESHKTRTVTLERVVTLELTYAPIELRNDSLLIHKDVYGRLTQSTSQEVVRVLGTHGYPPDQIDRPRLASVIDKARTAVIGVPLFLILKHR